MSPAHAHCALNQQRIHSECCAVIVAPVHMRKCDVTAAWPFKQPEPANLIERLGEDGSPDSSNSVLLVGLFLR